MNERTARLINRVAEVTGAKAREIKRTWNAVPGQRRHRLRRQFGDVASGKVKMKKGG